MHKIMVVDDEVVITDELEEMLDSHGYQVVGTAKSGALAVDLAEELHPDLVLMDIVMPGKMDGIEACGHIQKDMDIPVVFLTAYGDDAHVSRAKAVYPYGYIMKPYHDDQIKAAVECALEKKKREHDIDEALNEFRLQAESCKLK
ncbi:MAG: response regulator, partial [Thermodesulfobacteriota bacterium]|nr:response regulator [Thermodesulfobacteriota bacterium]